MATGALWGIPMTTDFLTLTQWLSPAFPLGSFAYSHGLETAMQDGRVKDAAGLEDWLSVILEEGSGRTDAILLCAALDGQDVAALAVAMAPSRERLEETLAQGAAFASTLRAMGRQVPDAPLPVAVGVACRGSNLDKHLIASVYLQNFMSNLVQIGVRFIPLGQREGQAILGRLNAKIGVVAEHAEAASVDDIASGAFMSDFSSMRHEAQPIRMFQT